METSHAVEIQPSSNVDGTFLWVAPVYQEIAEAQPWNTLNKFKSFPLGLYSLYDHHTAYRQYVSIYGKVLAVALVVYRPINLDKMKVLIESLETSTRTTRQRSSDPTTLSRLFEKASSAFCIIQPRVSQLTKHPKNPTLLHRASAPYNLLEVAKHSLADSLASSYT